MDSSSFGFAVLATRLAHWKEGVWVLAGQTGMHVRATAVSVRRGVARIVFIQGLLSGSCRPIPTLVVRCIRVGKVNHAIDG